MMAERQYSALKVDLCCKIKTAWLHRFRIGTVWDRKGTIRHNSAVLGTFGHFWAEKMDHLE
jgi:hypothetical protein